MVDATLHLPCRHVRRFSLCSTHQDVTKNWRNVIDSAQGEYIRLFGDDDILAVLPGFQTPTVEQLAGKDAAVRVRDYLWSAQGSNVTLYSACLTSVLRN